MENIIMEKESHDDAVAFLRHCVDNKFHNIGWAMGRYFHSRHPSVDIARLAVQCGRRCGGHIAEFWGLYPRMMADVVGDDCVADFRGRLADFSDVAWRCRRGVGRVTVTMTTCRRLDLMRRTVESFVRNCSDLASELAEWIVVDDNSSGADREEMKRLWPWMTWYWKRPDEKGHARSMNILKKMVKTPYVFHLEDDWLWYRRGDILTRCIRVLNTDKKLGQCLVNKNYGELPSDFTRIVGGVPRGGYWEHEWCSGEEFRRRHGDVVNCAYWPHYSLRPSLMRTDVWRSVGDYNEGALCFEREYAERYVRAGWKSAFLDLWCRHIGRLTTERHGDKKNAYELNNTCQFSDVPVVRVVNLDRRPDRWEAFTKLCPRDVRVKRVAATDGKSLDENDGQLQRIFENGDFGMRRGMVGCALSHIKLWMELLTSQEECMIILEDDAEWFAPEWRGKVATVLSKMHGKDLVYLCHHAKDGGDFRDAPAVLVRSSAEESLANSWGGTGGYIISSAGAAKLLAWIDDHGVTNGIDTVQQKCADHLSLWYCQPQLLRYPCCVGDNTVDSDIQRHHDTMELGLDERILQEISKWDNVVFLESLQSILEFIYDDDNTTVGYFKNNLPAVAALEDGWRHYSLFGLGGHSYTVVVPPGKKIPHDVRFSRLEKFKASASKTEG